MRLRECSDITLANSLYFELIDDGGSTLLDIHRNDLGGVMISIENRVIDFSEFVQFLNDARDGLSVDSK